MSERIFDLKTHLQQKLDSEYPNRFKVSNERSMDTKFEGEVIVSQLVGNANSKNGNFTFQLDITTKEIDEVMSIFEKFAKENSQIPFDDVVKNGGETFINTITPTYSTPVVMEKDIQVGSNHYARIVVFVNAFILFNSSSVKKIEIDGEIIDFDSGTLTWQASAIANQRTSRSNSKSFAESSAVSLTFMMKSQLGQFANKLQSLRKGTLDRNAQKFIVKITLTNEEIEEYTMIVSNQAFSFGKSAIPTINVGMVEKEIFNDDLEVVDEEINEE